MAKILVAGGLYEDQPNAETGQARGNFIQQLATEAIQRGHTILGGCRNKLDAEVATAAAAAAIERRIDPRSVVRSWVAKNATPSHNVGEIIRSRVGDWSQVPRGFLYPEPIQEADVVIIVGGLNGTQYAASWARLAGKPIVPVATFGLAAAEIFDDEMNHFERRYGTRLTPEEFQVVNRILQNWNQDTVESFTRDVLSLAEKLITPTEAFVMMSFAEEGRLIDAYNTFKRVCAASGFTAFKVDNHLDSKQRIVPGIISGIRRAAFIIADVTKDRPNVYYELGFAQALGKEVITTAAAGTVLPFDIFDVPTLFWDSQDSLERKLQPEIARIALKYGRRPADSIAAYR